jgi:5'-methylthioadenosine phosphorylase
VTDYDSWREEEEAVTAGLVMETIGKNVEVAKKAVAHAIEHLDEDAITPSHNVLDAALTTQREAMPQSEIDKLAPILKRALKL